MTDTDRSRSAEALTDLIFEIFRLHGELIAMGDRLVAAYDLTSARWQVVGSIDEAGQRLTVPMIARNLGLTRQAVQRVVNELVRDGLLVSEHNPHHRQARLIRLTDRGQTAVRQAAAAYAAWANAATADLDADELLRTRRLLETIRGRCRDGPADG